MLKTPVAMKSYRPEIDGLRAIAVLSVLLFHLMPDILPGGFTGVDVFFVISGFLISRNIFQAKREERFSYSGFYIGRIKRLYPTYITVIMATTVMAWLLLTPEVLDFYGAALLSSVLYFSNINFALESGYFDMGSELKPLLHTWSLSVEEQFYVFFPLLLLLIDRLKLNIKTILLVVLIVSFALNIFFIDSLQSEVFYYLPTRLWELGMGVILALRVYPHQLNVFWQKLIYIAGLALIVSGFFVIDREKLFPGYWALIPVMGTYFIIGSSEHLLKTSMLRLLQVKPMVTIGLLSYALYLWHWPIIIFYEYYFELAKLGIVDALIILFLSFALSWISTYLIEPPVRKGRFSNRSIVVCALCFSVTFVILGRHIDESDGAYYRYPKNKVKIYDQTISMTKEQVSNTVKKPCKPPFDEKLTLDYCIVYGDSDEIEFAIWGDSYVANLGLALHQLTDVSFIVIRTNACPPIAGVKKPDDLFIGVGCNEGINDLALEGLVKLAPKTVVLASRWSLYYHGAGRARAQHKLHFLCDDNCDQELSSESSIVVFDKKLKETVNKLLVKSKVSLIKGVPILSRRGAEIFFMEEDMQKQRIPSLDEHGLYQREIDHVLDEIGEYEGVYLFDPALELCQEEKCLLADDDYFYYFDLSHLTIPGWLSMKDELVKLF